VGEVGGETQERGAFFERVLDQIELGTVEPFDGLL